jgi:hypothetical protein
MTRDFTCEAGAPRIRRRLGTRPRGPLVGIILGASALLLMHELAAVAGMPSPSLADLPEAARSVSRTGLTDTARQRVEVISFFLLVLLGFTWVVQRVWNSLREDFARLPRLSYARALGLVAIWGLLFVLVLTMISGARELMTPGAWEKRGLTYRLVADPPPVEAEIHARFDALGRLRDRLFEKVRDPDETYAVDRSLRLRVGASDIPERLWHLPTPPGGRYVDARARRTAGGSALEYRPVVCEPESVGPDRLVLMSDGEIRWMPASEIERALRSGEP